MQISIPTGDCRVAVAAATKATKEQAAADRQTIWDRSFKSLKDGAVHNGLDVTAEREAEMRGMVDRDIEHMMEQHPSVNKLEVLLTYAQMLDRNESAATTLDLQDFYLLKEYLPK